MNKAQLKEINKLLLSIEDSSTLNQVILTVKMVQKNIQERAKSSFMVGEKVQWDGKYGHNTGTIEKINRKTIFVISDQGLKWKVSPSLLKACK